MAQFGWAYINCADSGSVGSGSAGPPCSLQFVTESAGATTGSALLSYYTASTYSYAPSTLVLSGNMIITGAISASIFHYEDITTIDATGSTYFGDDQTDIHARTGSLQVYNDSDTLQFSASAITGQTYVRGMAGNLQSVSTTNYTSSKDTLILGVTRALDTTLCIHSASDAGTGSILIIKDQVDRGVGGAGEGTKIHVSGSTGGAHETIDESNFYIMSGSYTAINLYSDGSNWWIF